ncbi:hypothetical protein EVAR_10335_1 [Eumeta japonica]|uniref:Uncharacterized protein n=1 Tax=Eumeta variegata TaxID=151549 RepID=A0A4C1TEX9_EUMVA|nr:hypothetical protein EVAR_10335_1 [Eumeta japonica]
MMLPPFMRLQAEEQMQEEAESVVVATAAVAAYHTFRSICTSGDVDIILWRDKRRVSLISTYHGDYFVRGNNQPILGLVHDYNLRMGGVDKKTKCLPLIRWRGSGVDFSTKSSINDV